MFVSVVARLTRKAVSLVCLAFLPLSFAYAGSYQDFKNNLSENYNFDYAISYSALNIKNISAAPKSRHSNGELDIWAGLRVFDGAGQFQLLYLDVKKLGGVSNAEFSARQGNATPITDSDEIHFLRWLFYQHHFADYGLTLYVGKTEPLFLMTSNRYAFNDRATFMMQALSNAVAKDRLLSSLGAALMWDVKSWLTLGISSNRLKFDEGVPTDFKDDKGYNFFHTHFKGNPFGWGEGNFKLNLVTTGGDSQGGFTRSNGIIISSDQDFGDRWSGFFRYDDTDIQTASTPFKKNVAYGVAYRQPFSRPGDIISLGLFQNRSEAGVLARHEYGGELFYKAQLNKYFDASLHWQRIRPHDLSTKTLNNIGVRVNVNF